MYIHLNIHTKSHTQESCESQYMYLHHETKLFLSRVHFADLETQSTCFGLELSNDGNEHGDNIKQDSLLGM